MKTQRVAHFEWHYYYLTLPLLLAGYFLIRPTSMHAQAQICTSGEGNNAVYGPCNGQTGVVGSTALIDASAWCNGNCQGADICQIIGDAIARLPSNIGGVVDARGVVYSATGGGETCTVNPFPQTTRSVPLTVLLPPEKILIQTTWILPSNTHVVGQNGNSQLVPTQNPPFQPDPNSPVPAMMEMGSASDCPSVGCTGVSIEHVKLDGGGVQVNGVGLTGIYNGYARDGSYVDDVSLYRIAAVSATQSPLTTGLLIDTGAAGSGPYTNINAASAASQLCTDNNSPPLCNGKPITRVPTAAVQIRATTRGLHGITTTARSTQCTSPAAAIYLDGSNNTIEDVHDEGYYDAVVVGDNVDGLNATVSGNAIWNVTGDYGGNSGPTTNAIHICNPQQPAGGRSACSSGTGTVGDLGLFQIESIGSNTGGGYVTTSIKDDLTNTNVNPTPFDAFVGIYALGELTGSSQYSRFTTSLGGNNNSSASIPTWGAGSTDVTGNTCSQQGALYSNTSGGNGQNANTLFVCAGSNWESIK